MQQPTILMVDDNPENLTVLGEILRSQYRVLVANSGARALQLAVQAPVPDLILLDVMMPGMSGYDVLSALRASGATHEIPVIFTTAMCTPEAEEHGLRLGAADFITKPLRPAVVLARTQAQLEAKLSRDRMKLDKAGLEIEVISKMLELQAIENVAIRALASLAETRDNETGNHILRTQAYVDLLARLAAGHPKFAQALDEHNITLITRSAPLHDVGKVGIPDRVLLKPGRLTPEERALMQTHAELGAQALQRGLADIGAAPGFLTHAIQIARHHHERWDGHGYPDKLAGDAIPLAARLMAIADVFDALISRRVYKEPMTRESARDLMAKNRATQFDPDLLDIFLANFDRFCVIAMRLPDAEPTPAPTEGIEAAALA